MPLVELRNRDFPLTSGSWANAIVGTQFRDCDAVDGVLARA